MQEWKIRFGPFSLTNQVCLDAIWILKILTHHSFSHLMKGLLQETGTLLLHCSFFGLPLINLFFQKFDSNQIS